MRKEVSSSKISSSISNIYFLSEHPLSLSFHRFTSMSFFCLKNCLRFFSLPTRIPTRITATCYKSLSLSLFFSSPSSIFQVVPRNFLFVSRELKPQNCSWSQTNRITGILFEKILTYNQRQKVFQFFSLFYFLLL